MRTDKVKFLHSKELTLTIKRVLKDGGTAAVAFVGEGATKFISSRKVKVICDFDSVGTNPYEIERLQKRLGAGAVSKAPGLHAKVYFSAAGAVVGSANLSTNGLALIEKRPAGSIETAVFLPPSCAAHKAIGKWLKGLKSGPISNSDIERMKTRWDAVAGRPRKRGSPAKSKEHIRFNDILRRPNDFVFCFWVAPSTINSKKDKISGVGMDAVSVDEFQESIGANVFMQDDDFFPIRNSRKFKKFAGHLLRPSTVVLSIKLNWPDSTEIPRLPKSAAVNIGKFRGSGPVSRKKSLLLFYKETSSKTGPIQLTERQRQTLLAALRRISQSRDWAKWVNGKLKSDWYGPELYLSGHTFKKMYKKS